MAEKEYLESKPLAKSYLQSGLFKQAIDEMEKYLDCNGNDVEALEILGDAYGGLKNNDMACENYLKALAIRPVDTGILLKYSSTKLTAPDYKSVLRKYHKKIKPKRYVEIGVCKGASFKLADDTTTAIGVDPEPQLDTNVLPEKHIVVIETSDNYFESGRMKHDLGGLSLDMAFLDGMHVFEFVLRDFMNLEKHSHSESVIFIHDLYPMNAETATRERNSDFWSGDVWKLVLCLKEYRPDLELEVLPCPPTGLGVITKLDTDSEVLDQHYEEILKRYVDMPFSVIEPDKDRELLLSGLDSRWLE